MTYLTLQYKCSNTGLQIEVLPYSHVYYLLLLSHPHPSLFLYPVTTTPGKTPGEQVLVQGNATKIIAKVLQSTSFITLHVHVYICNTLGTEE